MTAQLPLPRRIADISLDWLRAATQDHTSFSGDSIQSFTSQAIGSGIGQMGEFALIDARMASGATRRIFAKWHAPVAAMNEVARRYRMYEREVRFYDTLAPRLSTRTPRVYFAHYDHAQHQVGLLMEAFDGWRSPDQVAGASRTEIELALDQLIPITASLWNSNLDLEWLPTWRAPYMRAVGADYRACIKEFLNRYEARLPSNGRKMVQRIGEVYEDLSDHLADGNKVLTHYDYRVENMFFSPDGRDAVIVDWQLVQWMRPGWDFAYLLCTNITVENRRAWFDTLSKRYFDGLRAAGVSNYSPNEFARDLRATLCALTAITVIGGSNADIGNARSYALFSEIAARAFTAIEDLDALSALP